MAKILTVTRFGNPILRGVAQQLSSEEILSEVVQTLIDDMKYTLIQKKYGVGLAAPQVGRSIALSVIGIKPTPTRPNLLPFETVIINPVVSEVYGRRYKMWEGCISCGTGDDTLYGLAPRYKRIKLQWLDEKAVPHEEVLDGFIAHVAQHEVDHLNGVLFVDRVKDTSSYMMADEYKSRIVQKRLLR